jgi:hypothetical protein
LRLDLDMGIYEVRLPRSAALDIAAAAGEREEVKIHQCQLCGYVASQASDLNRHVSRVVSRSARVTHLFVSDLLCYVLLCFPR